MLILLLRQHENIVVRCKKLDSFYRNLATYNAKLKTLSRYFLDKQIFLIKQISYQVYMFVVITFSLIKRKYNDFAIKAYCIMNKCFYKIRECFSVSKVMKLRFEYRNR